MDSSKGFSRHVSAKKQLKCMALWKEKESCSTAGAGETLVNLGQLERNHKYFSEFVVEIIEFLVSNAPPLRGLLDAFSSVGEGAVGFFVHDGLHSTKIQRAC